MAEDGRERRGRIRVDYHGLAEIRVGGVRIKEAVLRDISAKGLFAETETKVESGQDCEVTIRLGSAQGPAMRVEGKVSRVVKGGFGVAFNAIDPESYTHLKNLVMYNSREAETEKVEEEFAHPGIK